MMNFPSEALLVLLKFAKGKIELNADVVDAGLEVLKYIYNLVMNKVTPVMQMDGDNDITQLLEQALDEHNSKLVQFTPGLWVTIGLWVLEVVLKKVLK
jgi:hypothetical protein